MQCRFTQNIHSIYLMSDFHSEVQKEIIESIEGKIQKCKQQLHEIQIIEAETPATIDQFFNSMCERITAYSQGFLDLHCRISMAYDSPTFICA